jgi:hypothetical protein
LPSILRPIRTSDISSSNALYDIPIPYKPSFSTLILNSIGFLFKVAPSNLVTTSFEEYSDFEYFDKYDEYIPNSLLQKAYAADKLDPVEASERFIEIFKEYTD